MNLPEQYIPVLIQAAVGLGFVLVSLVASHFLGPRLHGKKKDEAFECGVELQGNARTFLSLCCKLQRVWCAGLYSGAYLCSGIFYGIFLCVEKRSVGLG
jgi:hypothetical protein